MSPSKRQNWEKETTLTFKLKSFQNRVTKIAQVKSKLKDGARVRSRASVGTLWQFSYHMLELCLSKIDTLVNLQSQASIRDKIKSGEVGALKGVHFWLIATMATNGRKPRYKRQKSRCEKTVLSYLLLFFFESIDLREEWWRKMNKGYTMAGPRDMTNGSLCTAQEYSLISLRLVK